jgi:hypothetical protein
LIEKEVKKMRFIEKKESIVLVTYLVIFTIFKVYSILTGFSSTCRNAQINVTFFVILIPVVYWNLRKRAKNDPEHNYRLEYALFSFLSLFIMYLCIEMLYDNCFGG